MQPVKKRKYTESTLLTLTRLLWSHQVLNVEYEWMKSIEDIERKNRNNNTLSNHLVWFLRKGRGQGSPSRQLPCSVDPVPSSVMVLVLLHQMGSQTG